MMHYALYALIPVETRRYALIYVIGYTIHGTRYTTHDTQYMIHVYLRLSRPYYVRELGELGSGMDDRPNGSAGVWGRAGLGEGLGEREYWKLNIVEGREEGVAAGAVLSRA